MEIYPDLDMKRWEVSNSDGCILANADNYYTKYQVDKRLEGIIISGSVTSAQVETAIDEAVSGKVDSSDFEAFSASTDTALDNKLDASAYTPTDLSEYWTSGETEQWVQSQGYITGVDLSNYATLSDIPTSNSGLTNDAGYATSGYVDSSVSGKADSSDVQSLSGTVTAHTADTSIHFTTGTVQTQIDNSISGKADSSAVTADINAAVSGKQDTLSAGTNISITNNVISATDTTYSAGDGITITSATNKITLDANIYKGNGLVSVSLNNPSGTQNGYNRISGMTSIGAGFRVNTNNYCEAAFGTSNKTNGYSQGFNGSSGNTLFSVGNGTSSTNHNAFEIRQNGDIYFPDTNDSADYYSKPMIKLQDVNAALGGLKFVKLTQTEYDALSPNYDANTIYFIKD